MRTSIAKHNNSGMTLIETLIYIVIIGIIIVGLMSFSWSVANGRNKTYVSQEVQANIRLSTNIIKRKIRQADGIISPTAGNSSSSLVLNMPNPDADITFSLLNDVLQMTQSGNSVDVTSNRVVVSNLTFTNLAGSGERDNIRITMTISYKSNSADKSFYYSKDIQTAVGLLD